MPGRFDMREMARKTWARVPASSWPRAEIDTWRRNRSFSPVEPNPPHPDPVPDFVLYAIIASFAEEDIIESTVSNAFAQGCDRVFLIDNASPDATVARAASVGAEPVVSFETTVYDERLRWALVNAWIDHASTTSGADHVWWLLIDADEFPEAPGFARLRDFLATLDRRFRFVGTRFLNHFPTTPPYHERGRHPLDFQALAVEKTDPRLCRLGHNKHSLIRWDRDGDRIGVVMGWHRIIDPTHFVEPEQPIVLHHVPYRRREDMETRHSLLDAGRAAADAAGGGMLMRGSQFDIVYGRRWSEYNTGEWQDDGTLRIGVDPVPWWTIVGRDADDVTRWYRD